MIRQGDKGDPRKVLMEMPKGNYAVFTTREIPRHRLRKLVEELMQMTDNVYRVSHRKGVVGLTKVMRVK